VRRFNNRYFDLAIRTKRRNSNLMHPTEPSTYRFRFGNYA
jgi:hypothetical protein